MKKTAALIPRAVEQADMIQIVRTARISIGVGILKKSVFIVAVDLYGDRDPFHHVESCL